MPRPKVGHDNNIRGGSRIRTGCLRVDSIFDAVYIRCAPVGRGMASPASRRPVHEPIQPEQGDSSIERLFRHHGAIWRIVLFCMCSCENVKATMKFMHHFLVFTISM